MHCTSGRTTQSPRKLKAAQQDFPRTYLRIPESNTSLLNIPSPLVSSTVTLIHQTLIPHLPTTPPQHRHSRHQNQTRPFETLPNRHGVVDPATLPQHSPEAVVSSTLNSAFPHPNQRRQTSADFIIMLSTHPHPHDCTLPLTARTFSPSVSVSQQSTERDECERAEKETRRQGEERQKAKERRRLKILFREKRKQYQDMIDSSGK
ncbi:hypothetical protein K402DRAFT_404437 [Aulographum hederae CBS 113979]|uniref:Uncharacterized protein n=1 Tax=Aulographum hederae CBS 113979 TaxID=1176131 RepID=A0A6G1GZY6_9PEZI|nr:hypothetical protein K402DRAFT_404437 [Aulographum hederae CBS 113979]